LNSYLADRLRNLGVAGDVEGIAELLEPCPCCDYRTLSGPGGYDICPVCFWEDDGTSNLDSHSGPNHRTLREARKNFGEFGAVDEAARPLVLPDGPSRYARGGSTTQ
jgi:hypothetical protein